MQHAQADAARHAAIKAHAIMPLDGTFFESAFDDRQLAAMVAFPVLGRLCVDAILKQLLDVVFRGLAAVLSQRRFSCFL